MGHSESMRPMVSGIEERASMRVVYETLVMVAEYRGNSFPPLSAFWEVQTKDLSPTGVGFQSSRRPETDTLLLMFGNPQAKPIFVKARMARCVENKTATGTDFLVGCEFLERLKA